MNFGFINLVIVDMTAEMTMTVVINKDENEDVASASHSDIIPIGVVIASSIGIGNKNKKTPINEGIKNFAMLFPVSFTSMNFFSFDSMFIKTPP
jgi:hypothetical protein